MKIQIVALSAPILRVNILEVDSITEIHSSFNSGSRKKERNHQRLLSGYLLHSLEEYQWLCHRIEQWNEDQQIQWISIQEQRGSGADDDDHNFGERRSTRRSKNSTVIDYDQEPLTPSFYKVSPTLVE